MNVGVRKVLCRISGKDDFAIRTIDLLERHRTCAQEQFLCFIFRPVSILYKAHF